MYRPQMARYTGLVRQIKDKSRERKVLLAEKKVLPARKIFKHKELAARIAELTEDLEELRSEKALLLQQFEYAEDAGAEAFRKDIAAMEDGLQKLVDQEQKYSAALDKALEEYAEVEAQAAGLDPVELYEAQLAIRDSHEAAAQGKIELTFGKQYSPIRWMEAQGQARRLCAKIQENRRCSCCFGSASIHATEERALTIANKMGMTGPGAKMLQVLVAIIFL